MAVLFHPHSLTLLQSEGVTDVICVSTQASSKNSFALFMLAGKAMAANAGVDFAAPLLARQTKVKLQNKANAMLQLEGKLGEVQCNDDGVVL